LPASSPVLDRCFRICLHRRNVPTRRGVCRGTIYHGEQPIGASLGALYVVFRFPADPFAAEGEGGGPAVGYCAGSASTRGWISGDGEFWMRLLPEYSFAVVPQFVPLTEGMQVKRLGAAESDGVVPVLRPYLTAGPNPFNPITEFRFGLTHASDVVIDVYNLRGAKVARLLQAPLAAGHHTVSWSGVDHAGRRVASGPYFARLRAGSLTLTQRVMLVK